MSASSAILAQQGRARPRLGNESYLDSQNGITAGRRLGRRSVKKCEVRAHGYHRQSPQRRCRWYHSNGEGTTRTGSLRLGKNSVRRSLSLAAGVIGRHHGTSALVRHVVATLPFRGSHCRTRKNTRHDWCDRPQQGDRQQRECSSSSHSHQCTFSENCEQVAAKNNI